MYFIIVPSSEEYINCPIPPPVHSAIPINSMIENILNLVGLKTISVNSIMESNFLSIFGVYNGLVYRILWL